MLFSPNYKVRIAAADTLTVPSRWCGYAGRLPEAVATACEAAEMLEVSTCAGAPNTPHSSPSPSPHAHAPVLLPAAR